MEDKAKYLLERWGFLEFKYTRLWIEDILKGLLPRFHLWRIVVLHIPILHRILMKQIGFLLTKDYRKHYQGG